MDSTEDSGHALASPSGKGTVSPSPMKESKAPGFPGKEDEDNEHLLKLQKRAIDRMQKENDVLREELSILSRFNPSTVDTSESLEGAAQKLEYYTRKYELEKRRNEQLDTHIKAVHARIHAAAKESGNKSFDPERNQAKFVRVLEDRLTLGINKFNEALVFNKTLREQIENLRRERESFQVIMDRVNKMLLANKEQIARATEATNVAYEARDQAQTKIQAMKQQQWQERVDAKEELARLDALLQGDLKAKRAASGMDRREEEERKAREASRKAESRNAQDKAQLDRHSHIINFQQAFARLQAATGITDIDQLVTSFVDAEDENLSLLQYMNELTAEADKIEESKQELIAELEAYSGFGSNGDTQARNALIRSLEQKVTAAEATAESLDLKYHQGCKTIQESVAIIERGFTAIGATIDVNDVNLGSTGVSENNMMVYLGSIEQRTTWMLRRIPADKMAELMKSPLGEGGETAVTPTTASQGGDGATIGGAGSSNPAFRSSGPPSSSKEPVDAAAPPASKRSIRSPSETKSANRAVFDKVVHIGPSGISTADPALLASTGAASVGSASTTPRRAQSAVASSPPARSYVLGPGPQGPAGRKPLTIKPPVIGDAESESSDEEMDEVGERPLSREEIRTRTLRSMSKRGGGMSSRELQQLPNTKGRRGTVSKR
mmetsp:Transcript_20477/g.47878  ORF Transcript_20477/g.47878 Transcript_20477/m.47878 type:complete len:668 (+) Transcript_20477:80-2083(+)